MKKKLKKYAAQTRSILSWEARQADYYRAQGFLIAVVLIGLILWML